MDRVHGWFGTGRDGCAGGRRVADVSDGQIKKHPDVAVIEPVENVSARAAARNDALRPHEPKCLAHRGFTEPAHRSQIMDTDLTCFKQSGQNPDTAGVGHQPEHLCEAHHVGRGRQGITEGIDTRHFAGQPGPGHPVGASKRPNMSVHMNTLSFVHILAMGQDLSTTGYEWGVADRTVEGRIPRGCRNARIPRQPRGRP